MTTATWEPIKSQLPWSKLCDLVDRLDRENPAPAPSRNGEHGNGTAHANGTADRLTGSALDDRVRKYLAAIPPAIAGQRGHDRTFYAANRLVRGFGLSVERALPLFQEWNRRCDPPWADADLVRKLEEADRQPGDRGFLARSKPAAAAAARPGSPDRLANFTVEEVGDGETTRAVKRGRPAADILDDLLAWTGGWPRRVAGELFVRDATGYGVEWLDKPHKLFAWVAGQYGGGGQSGVDWAGGPDCLTKPEFHAYCAANCERFDSVEVFPHEPPAPTAYYVHPPVTGGDGTALAALLAFFSPATPHDAELIRAFFLTLVWGGPCGKRPLFVFEAEGDGATRGTGSGKTTVPEVASVLLNGFTLLSEKDDTRDIQVRLNTLSELTKRLVLYDNVKSLRFAIDYLEAWITSRTFSGRALHRGEGQRPNRLVWAMTFNSPSLGKDLSSRSVTVRVRKPVYTPDWQKRWEEHVEANRWAIIGDLVAELRRPPDLPDGFDFSRRADWDRDVLGKLADPAGIQQVLADRRQQVDVDDEEKEEFVEAIRQLIRDKFGVGANPDGMKVLIPSRVMFEKVVKPLKPEYKSPATGVRYLNTLNVQELKSYKDMHRRGLLWEGKDSSGVNLLLWDDL